MEIFLSASAFDWRGKPVRCVFKATADSSDLRAADDQFGGGSHAPLYKIEPTTQVVEVTAKPDSDAFWGRTIKFLVSSGGTITVDPQSKNFVSMAWSFSLKQTLTQATFKMSQFREVTDTAVKLLGDVPEERSVYNEAKKKFDPPKKTHELEAHNWHYGMSPPNGWPPTDWDLDGIPHVDFLDVVNPLKSGKLNFTPAPASLGTVLDVNSVVLERAGTFQVAGVSKPMVPRYFAVTWPQAIAPDANKHPTPFLLFIRQYNRWNYIKSGMFLGSYPESFDYVDAGMFESLHYAGPTPEKPKPAIQARSPLWWPSAKGVPYQAARAGVDVVCVFPCNKFGQDDQDPEYGVLNDPEETERTLLELQAFMFWKAAVDSPPNSLGKTVVAAFSAGNFFLNNWLSDATKRNGHFLSSVVRAIYSIEPISTYPDPKTKKTVQFLDGLIDSALKWADKDADKRIRLYLRYSWPSLKRLVAPLPSPPFFSDPPPSGNNNRTLCVIPIETWTKTVGRAPSRPLLFNDVHHLMAATMLTHAFAQGDFKP